MGIQTVREQVLNLLRDNEVRTIILGRKPGIGKTWMAREMSDSAISKGLHDRALWLYLNKKCDKKSLLQSIACQLSLLCTDDEFNCEYDNEEWRKKKRRKNGSSKRRN